MSCPNIKTHFIRMHNTKFWCCDEFKFDKEWYDRIGPDETSYESSWKYCPWCGSKIR